MMRLGLNDTILIIDRVSEQPKNYCDIQYETSTRVWQVVLKLVVVRFFCP